MNFFNQGYDPIAKKFIDYVESINETLTNVEKTSLNKFCKDLRQIGVVNDDARHGFSSIINNRRRTFRGCYPLIGQTEVVKSLNLIDPEKTINRITFSPTWDLTGDGVKGDGSISESKISLDHETITLTNIHDGQEIFLYSVLSDETNNPYYDFINLFNTNARKYVVSKSIDNDGNFYKLQINNGYRIKWPNKDAKGVWGYIHDVKQIDPNSISPFDHGGYGVCNGNIIWIKDSRGLSVPNKYNWGQNSLNRYGVIIQLISHNKYWIDFSQGVQQDRKLFTQPKLRQLCEVIKQFDTNLGRCTYDLDPPLINEAPPYIYKDALIIGGINDELNDRAILAPKIFRSPVGTESDITNVVHEGDKVYIQSNLNFNVQDNMFNIQNNPYMELNNLNYLEYRGQGILDHLSMFRNNPIEQIILPNLVEETTNYFVYVNGAINAFAFRDLNLCTKINLSNIKVLTHRMFYNLPLLTELIVNNVEYVATKSLRGLSSLTELNLRKAKFFGDDNTQTTNPIFDGNMNPNVTLSLNSFLLTSNNGNLNNYVQGLIDEYPGWVFNFYDDNNNLITTL